MMNKLLLGIGAAFVCLLMAGTGAANEGNGNFTILFSGKTHGYTVPSGWGSNKLGGLPRRYDYINSHAEVNRKTTLVLDTGNIFTKRNRCNKQNVSKLNYIRDYYQKISYDAINVSSADLSAGLTKQESEGNVSVLPLISANILQKSNQEYAFQPYVIRQIEGNSVGIIGLSDSDCISSIPEEYIIDDLVTSAQKIIPQVRNKAELVIVLSSMSRVHNAQLLQQVDAIDFILSAVQGSDKVSSRNKQYMVTIPDNGTHLGHLKFRLSQDHDRQTIHNVTHVSKLQSDLRMHKYNLAKLAEIQPGKNASLSSKIHNKYIKKRNDLEGLIQEKQKEIAQLKDYANSFKFKLVPMKKRKHKVYIDEETMNNTASRQNAIQSKKASLIIDRSINSDKKTMTYSIKVKNAPNRIRSLGMDIQFPHAELQYKRYKKGALVEQFDMFDTHLIQDGVLRVGGFEARSDYIPEGASGDILQLEFQIHDVPSSSVIIYNLVDDISYWNAKNVF